MADNSTMGGTTDLIRDKDRSGVKTQILGLDVGIGTGTEALMSSTNPLPTFGPDTATSGTITATDAVLGVYVNDGAVKTGTPTASSYVALAVGGGESAFVARFSGTFGSGTVWIEVSPDSTNGIDGGWTTALARMSGNSASFLDESIQAAGIYRGNAAGMTYVRFRITGATAPSVAIAARASDGTGALFLNAAIPAGTNNIGVVGPATATTGAITSPALAVTSFTVLAANTARKTATVYNESAYTVYLAMAATASVTSYSVQIPSGGYYELPGTNAVFTGLISGIALAASGNLRVTELT